MFMKSSYVARKMAKDQTIKDMINHLGKLRLDEDMVGESTENGNTDADAGGDGDPGISSSSAAVSEDTKVNENGDTSLAEHTEKRETTTSDCVKLFEHAISKKTNMYSADPFPLNNPWTFWVERSRRGVGVEEFEANLNLIYTVYTVHLFWGVFYNIPLPSALNTRSSLHMSRDERKPIWEEEYNCKGGTFRMKVHKKDTDKVWRELLMAAVGEQLNEFVSPNDDICGVSVSVRDRDDTILIWNANAKEIAEAKVFECVRMLLPDTQFISEYYKPHETHHAFDKHTEGVPMAHLQLRSPKGNNSDSDPQLV